MNESAAGHAARGHVASHAHPVRRLACVVVWCCMHAGRTGRSVSQCSASVLAADRARAPASYLSSLAFLRWAVYSVATALPAHWHARRMRQWSVALSREPKLPSAHPHPRSHFYSTPTPVAPGLRSLRDMPACAARKSGLFSPAEGFGGHWIAATLLQRGSSSARVLSPPVQQAVLRAAATIHWSIGHAWDQNATD